MLKSNRETEQFEIVYKNALFTMHPKYKVNKAKTFLITYINHHIPKRYFTPKLSHLPGIGIAAASM